jgi:hypothetical protein
MPISPDDMRKSQISQALGAVVGALAVSCIPVSLPAAATAQTQPVRAAFAVDPPAPYRVRERLEFAALATGYPRYVWRFGDGTTGRGARVAHRYSEEGTFVVSLEVSRGSQIDYQTRRLTILGAPSGDTLPTIRGHSDRSHKDPEYSRAAASLTKAATGGWGPRSVFCWSEADWRATAGGKSPFAEGFVEWASPRRVNLAPEVCRGLELVRYKRPRPAATKLTAVSLLIFTHEVFHTLGVANEAMATCFGLQLAPRMATYLGANRSYASRVALLLGGWYKQSNLAPGYWTSACRDGGPLDLDRSSSSWPYGAALRGL